METGAGGDRKRHLFGFRPAEPHQATLLNTLRIYSEDILGLR